MYAEVLISVFIQRLRSFWPQASNLSLPNRRNILKIRKSKEFINIILVNVMTNPLVVSLGFVINIIGGIFYRRIFMIIIEILVVLIEGFIYKKCFILKPYRLSFILNLSSYLIGFIIIYLEGVFL